MVKWKEIQDIKEVNLSFKRVLKEANIIIAKFFLKNQVEAIKTRAATAKIVNSTSTVPLTFAILGVEH